MSGNINILDKEYLQWVRDLGSRYRRTQIKAAVKVNQEVIRFYWELGRDISEMHVEERWGDKVIRSLAVDLQRQIPDAKGLSPRNIYYCKLFYRLYSQYVTIVPQVVAQLDESSIQQPVIQPINTSKQNLPQVGEEFKERLFSVPWGHHRFIMDKCYDAPTIGLLICKEKDTLVAQYAVEASSQPLGISEYDLAALYPEKVEGTIPTIEEIETKLANMD